LIVFFAVTLLGFASVSSAIAVYHFFALSPAEVLHKPWQVLTYTFMPGDVLSTLFALISIWTFGATLEDERGPRWLTEYFLVSTIGGAVLASLIVFLPVLAIDPLSQTVGLWPAILAIMLAFARFYPEQDIQFFVLTVKAKYLTAIYLLVYLALALVGGNRLGALTALCASLCGYLYLRFVPRRGLSFAASESLFGIRNMYYRSKRKRAAKKFTVYMKKQGKDVNVGQGGPRDPNDKGWMN
jgi:membrane associated rhomboid family serine protease